MMDGREGPRIPLEFVGTRMPSMPRHIVYDFACGANRAALCHVPTIASTVNASVDVIHYRKGHKSFSVSRSSSAYLSLRTTNTSASEQRNAATARLKPFLRLRNQRNFLTFSSYQKTMSNIAAMHREAGNSLPKSTRGHHIGWLLWFRKIYLSAQGGN